MKRLITIVFMLTLSALLFATTVSAEEANTCVKEGVIYYESSQRTGKHNVVNQNNPYVNEDRKVIINGWSIIDDNNEILDCTYDDYATSDISLPNIPDGTNLMVHIKGVFPDKCTRLGWISNSEYTQVKAGVSEETTEDVQTEKRVREAANVIIKGIVQDKESKQDTVIVFDCSGSMMEYMQKVFNQIEGLKEEKHPIYLYAFGSCVSNAMKPEEINEETWEKITYNYGGLSNITGGIMKSAEENPQAHIYLITDLFNTNRYWETVEAFEGRMTIIQYGSLTENECNDIEFYKEIAQNLPRVSSIELEFAN